MSAIKTWFIAFYEDYLCLNMKDYPNIGFDFEIVKVLLVSAIVLCVVFCVMDFHKKNAYLIIKQLMRHEARSSDSAKTLSELGLASSKPAKRALASPQLRSVVGRIGEKKMTYEEFLENEKLKKKRMLAKFGIGKKNAEKGEALEANASSATNEDVRYYIMEERSAYASKIYNGADISVLRMILRCVLVMAIAVCFTMLMPELLSFANNIFA